MLSISYCYHTTLYYKPDTCVDIIVPHSTHSYILITGNVGVPIMSTNRPNLVWDIEFEISWVRKSLTNVYLCVPSDIKVI